MFDFRLIALPDGNQIIDSTFKTPYNSLTPASMLEYIEVDKSLCVMKRLERKRKAEEAKKNTFAYRLKMVLLAVTKQGKRVSAQWN